MASKTFHEEEILKAAEELFVEHGYNATSTTDIAKRVGCNQALIHYYFRNKENLFQQIFTKKIETILSYFSAPLDETISRVWDTWWFCYCNIVCPVFFSRRKMRKKRLFL